MKTFFGVWALFIGVIVAIIIAVLLLIQVHALFVAVFPTVGNYIFAVLLITGFFAALIAISDDKVG
ncbi:hypothetical protein [Niallia circulans]|uniref:hypothetical protein n=1 Tax=Niallia circulans TaxID=1397 RepID=UPI001561737B|nr:hypothetical protein [Niallia circulans]NRG33925.1 hypothetical protein [Niallia circulans]